MEIVVADSFRVVGESVRSFTVLGWVLALAAADR